MNPPISLNKIDNFISEMRKDDIISSNLFARKCLMSPEVAVAILNDLVGKGILDYFIIAPCQNSLEDSEHYITFNKINDVNDYVIKENKCNICDRMVRIDPNKIRIGFKLHYD